MGNTQSTHASHNNICCWLKIICWGEQQIDKKLDKWEDALFSKVLEFARSAGVQGVGSGEKLEISWWNIFNGDQPVMWNILKSGWRSAQLFKFNSAAELIRLGP